MKVIYSTVLSLALIVQALPATAGGSCCSNETAAATTTCATSESQVVMRVASASLAEDADVSRAIDQSAVIATLLAADKVDGISGHARDMAKALGLDHMGGTMGEGQDDHLANISSQLAILGDEATSLEAARVAFLSLQDSFIPLAIEGYHAGDDDPAWTIYNCSMAKGSWIQLSGEVLNPFYGSKMLRCGSPVATLTQAQNTAAAEDHGKSGHVH